MRRLIPAAMLALMTSCGTAKYIPTEEEELTQTWAGKEYNDIVQSYGAPDRVETDGKDGSIMVYEEFMDRNGSGHRRPHFDSDYYQREARKRI